MLVKRILCQDNNNKTAFTKNDDICILNSFLMVTARKAFDFVSKFEKQT